MRSILLAGAVALSLTGCASLMNYKPFPKTPVACSTYDGIELPDGRIVEGTPTSGMPVCDDYNQRGDAIEHARLVDEENKRAAAQRSYVATYGAAFPHYDMDQRCSQYRGGFFNMCRNQEQDAYDAVRGLWTELSAENRTQCGWMNSTIKSYQTLYSCTIKFLRSQDAWVRFNHSTPFRY